MIRRILAYALVPLLAAAPALAGGFYGVSFPTLEYPAPSVVSTQGGDTAAEIDEGR